MLFGPVPLCRTQRQSQPHASTKGRLATREPPLSPSAADAQAENVLAKANPKPNVTDLVERPGNSTTSAPTGTVARL